jgi:hypothetical protein
MGTPSRTPLENRSLVVEDLEKILAIFQKTLAHKFLKFPAKVKLKFPNITPNDPLTNLNFFNTFKLYA